MVPLDIVVSPQMTYPSLGLSPKLGWALLRVWKSSLSEARLVEVLAGVCQSFVPLRTVSYGCVSMSTNSQGSENLSGRLFGATRNRTLDEAPTSAGKLKEQQTEGIQALLGFSSENCWPGNVPKVFRGDSSCPIASCASSDVYPDSLIS